MARASKIPVFLRNEQPKLATLQRQRSRKKKGSCRYQRLTKQMGRLHEHIANVRRDFLHKATTKLVESCAVIATEELKPKNMSRSSKGSKEDPGKRVRQKSGLNREILSAGFGMAHQMLRYEAEEAGARLHLANTRQLKPSQRCCVCWELTPKTLAERTHVCQHCGHTMPRDQNSAAVVLIDAHTLPEKGTAGTVVAARSKSLARQRVKPRSKTRETPTTTAIAV